MFDPMFDPRTKTDIRIFHFHFKHKIQGVTTNIGIQRRIRNRLCKELALCYLIFMVKIMLRLLEYIFCKR